DMMLAAINGIAATVPVTSRSAYSRRSAGAISGVCPIIAQPSFITCAFASARDGPVRNPRIDSGLSGVPAVGTSLQPAIILERAEQHRHEQRRHLVVGDPARRVGGDQGGPLLWREGAAVALALDERHDEH